MAEGQCRDTIRFVLNDEDIALGEIPATQTLLDFLRLDQRLKGSKEGCAEGDCGACTVLVGRLSGEALVYSTATACIAFTAALDGAHVVTIEALAESGSALHPVQQAMVDHHGSQCGFCTPGIVMSLYGMWLGDDQPSQTRIETALQGNLCRCTGYSPIVRAAKAISTYGAVEIDPLNIGRAAMTERLQALRDGGRVEVGTGKYRAILPGSVDDLAAVYEANPTGTVVGGATDVGLWVTKFMRDVGPMIFTQHLEEFHRITEGDESLTLGAGATYSEALPALVRHFPQLGELLNRLGGEQVRNMGTIGGNIANGSPIGDMPPPLLALGGSIVLRKRERRRTVWLDDYFIAYGKQDREPGEFVESVTVPYLPVADRFAVYKVTKRRDEDISALCGAFRVRLDGDVVGAVRIAFGGMAATPKRARAVEAALLGQPWTEASIEAALGAFAVDYQPLSDLRASAEYRLLAAQNLLRRFFYETTGGGARLVRELA
ncbi:MAG: xdhA [Devosia sp.]|nr:xdhA [Devosia sp.]